MRSRRDSTRRQGLSGGLHKSNIKIYQYLSRGTEIGFYQYLSRGTEIGYYIDQGLHKLLKKQDSHRLFLFKTWCKVKRTKEELTCHFSLVFKAVASDDLYLNCRYG